jgi:hypothetical protein
MTKEFNQIERNQRALALDVKEQMDDKIYSVRGSTGNVYTVDLARQTCNCPDFQYRAKLAGGVCKHITRAKIEVALTGVVA